MLFRCPLLGYLNITSLHPSPAQVSISKFRQSVKLERFKRTTNQSRLFVPFPPRLLGIIHFGIEANETKEEQVTPEAIHSEVPVYSEDVLAVNSNASTLSMSSNNTENMTSGANLKRVPSSSRSTISRKSSNSSESSRKSGYANSGFKRLVLECTFSFGINGMD